jgi:hypothetical protein
MFARRPFNWLSAVAALVVLTVAVTEAAPQAAGQAQSPTVAEATARLQANDPAGAVAMLEVITAREPANVAAWRLFGVALQRSKDYERGLAAFLKVEELQPGAPGTFYNLGVTHALMGDADQAFEWLGRAREGGRFDMTRMEVDVNLAGLKADPRYRALMPTDADFADPFVEPVTVIREWVGEATNDQFGWIARNIGDVDGDAVADVVTSAPTRNIRGANAGRVYVYSTQTGKLLWTADGLPGDQLGIGIEAAGDTNGDGIPDVVASAPGAGRAYIYSGLDGRMLFAFSGRPNENFGRHVSGVGDMNGDGHADVMVGAPGRGTTSPDTGRALVYSGKDGAVLLELEGEAEGDAFGSTVAGHPFGDGPFLIVGAPGAGPTEKGRGYVYEGLTPTPKFVVDADATAAALGAMFASIPGDVDGDGVDDVYLSDWSNAALGPSTGRVYVHSGQDGRQLYVFTGETAGEGFGTSPSNAGDVDGDGHADLIVGAWQYGGAAISGGRAYLYSGRDGSLMKTFTCKTPGDTFGFDAVGMGDVDGDGTIDLLITSAWSGIRGFHSGRMFIISSGVAAGRPQG